MAVSDHAAWGYGRSPGWTRGMEAALETRRRQISAGDLSLHRVGHGGVVATEGQPVAGAGDEHLRTVGAHGDGGGHIARMARSVVLPGTEGLAVRRDVGHGGV